MENGYDRAAQPEIKKGQKNLARLIDDAQDKAGHYILILAIPLLLTRFRLRTANACMMGEAAESFVTR